MSDQNWNAIRVLQEPLRIIFSDKSGKIKGANIDELFESETEWKRLDSAKGGSLPDSAEPFFTLPDSSKPFFTRAEAAEARRVLCDMGILLG